MKCRHCGQTLGRLAMLAMLEDAGCTTSPDANECYAREGGGEHDFYDVVEDEKRAADILAAVKPFKEIERIFDRAGRSA